MYKRLERVVSKLPAFFSRSSVVQRRESQLSQLPWAKEQEEILAGVHVTWPKLLWRRLTHSGLDYSLEQISICWYSLSTKVFSSQANQALFKSRLVESSKEQESILAGVIAVQLIQPYSS